MQGSRNSLRETAISAGQTAARRSTLLLRQLTHQRVKRVSLRGIGERLDGDGSLAYRLRFTFLQAGYHTTFAVLWRPLFEPEADSQGEVSDELTSKVVGAVARRMRGQEYY